MRVSVIGTGYVGLVSAVCLTDKGHQVICVDIDREKVEKINQGVSPIYERGLDELLTNQQLRASALSFSGKPVSEILPLEFLTEAANGADRLIADFRRRYDPLFQALSKPPVITEQMDGERLDRFHRLTVLRDLNDSEFAMAYCRYIFARDIKMLALAAELAENEQPAGEDIVL